VEQWCERKKGLRRKKLKKAKGKRMRDGRR